MNSFSPDSLTDEEATRLCMQLIKMSEQDHGYESRKISHETEEKLARFFYVHDSGLTKSDSSSATKHLQDSLSGEGLNFGQLAAIGDASPARGVHIKVENEEYVKLIQRKTVLASAKKTVEVNYGSIGDMKTAFSAKAKKDPAFTSKANDLAECESKLFKFIQDAPS